MMISCVPAVSIMSIATTFPVDLSVVIPDMLRSLSQKISIEQAVIEDGMVAEQSGESTCE